MLYSGLPKLVEEAAFPNPSRAVDEKYRACALLR